MSDTFDPTAAIPEADPGNDTGLSPWYFYVCEHVSSNTPCPLHFPGAPIMADDWFLTYTPPAPPGTTDATNLG